MEFRTMPQRQTYERVFPWVKELFGAFAVPRPETPVFDVTIGSALAQIGVSPWGEDDATVTTRAYVVTQVELTPGLMRFLLRENDKMRFGAFGIDADDNIFFEHTIVGSTCDQEELRGSVMAVVVTADQYIQVIMERWGGQNALERLP
ncbi:MAG: YbjN domain-containing protein [Anaerolineaceae bacterium]|nr:YbjN domain-containing protein [Anaerolineaceae bacterium]